MRRSLSVLVVDDDPGMLSYLKTLLSIKWNHRVALAKGGGQALQLLREKPQPDLVLLDICMPDMGGLEVLRQLGRLKEPKEGLPVIVISGMENVKTVVEAMQLGAMDYLKKPFEEEELDIAIRKALERRVPMEEVKSLRNPTRAKDEVIPMSNSKAMGKVMMLVERVADTDATVLLQGESGVGKDVIAQFLHRQSPRRQEPFVRLNCAAIPSGLLESELFGYERGAFTGAQRQKPGQFELAHKGTIFLNEIGEADPLVQAKLLQVLEQGKFTHLGGERDIQVNVRIVAATNRNLESAVKDGRFRSDLYYRINVINIAIPPLRERNDDIPALCQYFLDRYNARYNRRRKDISQELMRLLMQYDWPGNVRELENMIKRVVALDDEGLVTEELLQATTRNGEKEATPVAVEPNGSEDLSLKEIGQKTASKAERDIIFTALTRTNWNRQKAANILGITSRTLFTKMKKYDLS